MVRFVVLEMFLIFDLLLVDIFPPVYFFRGVH